MVSFHDDNGTLEVRHRHEVIRVQAWGADSAREAWSYGPAAWSVEDQFLFGPDILIAPVLVPNATARDVYLPAGCRWTQAATGQRHDGGSAVRVPVSPDRIPVFTREGAEVLDVVR